MPYALTTYVGTGRDEDSYAPLGAEQPGWSAIDLRDRSRIAFDRPGGPALIWTPSGINDPRVDFLAESAEDDLVYGVKRCSNRLV